MNSYTLHRNQWPHCLKHSPRTVWVEYGGVQHEFRRAVWQFPKPGIALQYRQVSCPQSGHLYVGYDGTWWIDHIDRANPDPPCGMVVQHLFRDVLK